MKTLFPLFMALYSVAALGQPPAAINKAQLQFSEKIWSNWFSNLESMGVEAKNDSLIIREEVIKLFTDSQVRQSAYPAQYTWPQTITLLKKMELKKAFWHMLNLYEADSLNRSYVLGTFVTYDSVMNMEKVLVSTYYTYAFADPRVSRLKNNKPDIYRPDKLEQGVNQLKEIIRQIFFYRQKRLGKQ